MSLEHLSELIQQQTRLQQIRTHTESVRSSLIPTPQEQQAPIDKYSQRLKGLFGNSAEKMVIEPRNSHSVEMVRGAARFSQAIDEIMLPQIVTRESQLDTQISNVRADLLAEVEVQRQAMLNDAAMLGPGMVEYVNSIYDQKAQEIKEIGQPKPTEQEIVADSASGVERPTDLDQPQGILEPAAPKIEAPRKQIVFFDETNRTICYQDNKPVKLTDLEFELVKHFFENPNIELQTADLKNLPVLSESKNSRVVRDTLKSVMRKLGQEIFTRQGAASSVGTWKLDIYEPEAESKPTSSNIRQYKQKRSKNEQGQQTFKVTAIYEPDDPAIADLGLENITPIGSITFNPEGEIIEIPYEPSPEQVRTPEEARILSVIVNGLIGNDWLHFDRIQNAILTNQVLTTDQKPRTKRYDRKELRDIFKVAVEKFLQESQIPALQKRWTEEDTEVWEKLQKLIQRRSLGNGSQDEFVKKAVSRINAAEQNYYDIHPSDKPGTDW